jgi:H+/Cl- antiporter ClcA
MKDKKMIEDKMNKHHFWLGLLIGIVGGIVANTFVASMFTLIMRDYKDAFGYWISLVMMIMSLVSLLILIYKIEKHYLKND